MLTIIKIFQRFLPKHPTWLIEESLLVAYDIRVLDGRQDSNFVQGVLLLFECQVIDVDFLHGVDLRICYSFNLVDAGVGASTFN